MNEAFKDLFSGHAQDYARYRPNYPAELFSRLASLVKDHRAAWDCATGSGQAAVALAPYFEKVFATDASEKQLAAATADARVVYSKGTAEASGLGDQSVSLVTVAQAFHWFKHEAFFAECRRVCRPGESVLAIWVYNLARVNERVDKIVDHYYRPIVGRFWEPERRLVEEGYSKIAVPFTPLPFAPSPMETHWSLEQFIGYIGTWSATQTARKQLGRDPREEIIPTLTEAWGAGGADASGVQRVTWPSVLRVFSL